LGDRETALRNLKKANEARRKGKQQKAPDDWEARSRVRLERIIEKTERELTKSDTMDGVDVAKLTNALKVCHQAHRAMKDGGDDQIHFRTAAEAHEHLDKTVSSLIGAVERMAPGGKRWVRETMLYPLAKATGDTLEIGG
jgi:hypothetical protein